MKNIISVLSISSILTACSTFGGNPFLSADWWQNATPQMVENQIQKGADVKAKDENGLTPLMYAAGHAQNSQTIGTLT